MHYGDEKRDNSIDSAYNSNKRNSQCDINKFGIGSVDSAVTGACYGGI